MRIVPYPLALVKSIVGAPDLLRVRPALNTFLAGYLRKFPAMEIGGRTILHSHLPPLNSKAYARFVRAHFIDRVAGPSHAQVAVTNACPQKCPICYNRDRDGVPLSANEVKNAVRGLVDLGVVCSGSRAANRFFSANCGDSRHGR